MKAFTYNGINYLRVVPGKSLFRSTMVHEVVNRGDIFGMAIGTQILTIIPGNAKVEHFELAIWEGSLPSRPATLVEQIADAAPASGHYSNEQVARLKKLAKTLRDAQQGKLPL